tara:strand:- start:812 stop:1027 length:216 start_codon:yes stop_codon:yes gene_type:complete
MAREYTNRLLEAVEEGWFDKDYVILAFCKFLSEDDVKEFMRINFYEDFFMYEKIDNTIKQRRKQNELRSSG